MDNHAEPRLLATPGKSLGDFHLYSSLYDVTTFLSKNQVHYTAIEVIANRENLFGSFIMVNLPNQGILLRFVGASQILVMIEVYDLSKCCISWGKHAQDWNQTKTRGYKDVYNLKLSRSSEDGFCLPAGSPGYPFGAKPENGYVLKYPGVLFHFSVDKSKADLIDNQPIPTLLNSKLTSSVVICPEQIDSAAAFRAFFDNHGSSLNRVEDGSILMAEVIDPKSTIVLHRSGALGFTVKLNQTTKQDLLSELGSPPDRAYESNLDTDMADPAEQVARPESIISYPNYGIDFVFNPAVPPTGVELKSSPPGSVLTDVIFRGNVHRTYEFCRHGRCRWRFPGMASVNSEAPVGRMLAETWLSLRDKDGYSTEYGTPKSVPYNRRWEYNSANVECDDWMVDQSLVFPRGHNNIIEVVHILKMFNFEFEIVNLETDHVVPNQEFDSCPEFDHLSEKEKQSIPDKVKKIIMTFTGPKVYIASLTVSAK